jgi:hypothetical protein
MMIEMTAAITFAILCVSLASSPSVLTPPVILYYCAAFEHSKISRTAAPQSHDFISLLLSFTMPEIDSHPAAPNAPHPDFFSPALVSASPAFQSPV